MSNTPFLRDRGMDDKSVESPKSDRVPWGYRGHEERRETEER